MEFNKLVFAGLALGCLGAAAGGSYLATRNNQVSSLEAPVSVAPNAPAPGAPATSAPVTESEGVISPEPSRTPRTLLFSLMATMILTRCGMRKRWKRCVLMCELSTSV